MNFTLFEAGYFAFLEISLGLLSGMQLRYLKRLDPFTSAFKICYMGI